MATAALPQAPPLFTRLSDFQRFMIMAASMMAMMMQVLDMTIANVALPHMRTSLGATPETVTWVLTSYIVASAVAMPITGWLSDRVGRKAVYVCSVAGFTAASTLCAIAQNLPEMVLFRIFQGVSGALIVPICQALLLDIYPPEKHAKAMTYFSAGTLLGPVIGPLLGGFLTDNFDWRWVFLVNTPIGIVCTLLLIRFMPASERTDRPFDLFGFALLALALGGLQMMLDRGQTLDWFASWEIWIECGLAIAAGWMFTVHIATTRHPLFESAMFADRNFVATVLIGVVLGLVVIGGSALLPSMLQGLLGYSVMDSGIMAAPRGVGSIVAMLLASRLSNKVDPRIMIFAGTLLAGMSLWYMTGFTLDMDRRPVIIANFVQGLGLGLTYVPVAVLAFATISAHLRTSAASVLTVSRNLGGSIGVSIVTTLLARNIQTSHSDLSSEVTASNLPVLDPSVIGTFGNASDMAMTMLDAEINRQAAMIAYVDVFHFMMIATMLSLPLVLLLRKPDGPPSDDPPPPME